MEKKIPVKTLYLLLVISIGLIGLGVGSTYAVFTTSAEISNSISLSSNLSYDSDILETVNVTVPAGETISTTLNITNSNDSTLNYVTWYMDGGNDVEVVGEDGLSSGTVTSGNSTSVVVSVRNYTYESVTVTIGISSSTDSVVLGNDMKQVEDVNFLMSISEDETVSASTSFLNSNLTREQISSVTFVDNNNVPSGYTSADVSKYSDGSILMWYGSANDSGYYDVYIGSDNGTTYIDSGYYLFGYLSNCTAINFNDLVDVSKTITLKRLFNYSVSLVSLDVSNWDVSNVMIMHTTFSNCRSLTVLDVSNWNTINVTEMTAMFQCCVSLLSLDLSNWDVSNVTNMYRMFASNNEDDGDHGVMVLTSIGDVSNWDTANVTNMQAMFQCCSSLLSLDLSNWNVSNVTILAHMFYKCSSLTELDLSRWETSKVTTLAHMFYKCSSLTTLNLNNWKIGNVTSLSSIFAGCSNLRALDLSDWDTSNVTDMSHMFNRCTNLNTIYVSDKWSTASVTESTDMFNNCTSLVGGAGTVYSASYLDATYAKVDGGTSSPGYFTSKV